MPLWLDSVPTVPLVGVRVSLPASTALHLRQLISPALDRWEVKNLKAASGAIEVTTRQGVLVRLKTDNIVATVPLGYETRVKPGSFYPDLHHEELLAYSEALEAVIEHMADALEAFVEEARLEVNQYGVVADARLREDALPPGIRALIRHLGAQWPAGLEKSETVLLALLDEQEGHRDRCHHHINFDKANASNGEVPYRIALDWQRVLASPLRPDGEATKLTGEIEKARDAALRYFEEVAFNAD